MKKAILFISIILLSILGITYGVTYVQKQAKYNVFQEQILKAENDQKSVFDEMWKTIKGQLKVDDRYREDFEKSLDAYVNKSKPLENSTWTWQTEGQVPIPSDQIRIVLMETISNKNRSLTEIKKTLSTIAAERNAFVLHPINVLFLSKKKRTRYEARLIQSDVTNTAFETGEDNLDWYDAE